MKLQDAHFFKCKKIINNPTSWNGPPVASSSGLQSLDNASFSARKNQWSNNFRGQLFNVRFIRRTLEDVRNFTFEVHEAGNFVEAVFLGLVGVVYLDEHNSLRVAFIIDVFQLLEHLLTLALVSVVWRNRTKFIIGKLIYQPGKKLGDAWEKGRITVLKLLYHWG